MDNIVIAGISFPKDHEHVDLEDTLFSGEFPLQLLKMTNLQILDLSDNGIKFIPPEIGYLTTLRKLMIWDNYLEVLPPEIGKLTNLVFLDVDHNLLKTLPPEIGNLTNLEQLHLNGNNIQYLPYEIRNLRKVEIFPLFLKKVNILMGDELVNVNFREFMEGGSTTKACKN